MCEVWMILSPLCLRSASAKDVQMRTTKVTKMWCNKLASQNQESMDNGSANDTRCTCSHPEESRQLMLYLYSNLHGGWD